MDDCEKFNEESLSAKEDFYSHFNMEDITDADYAHKKRVCKDFEIKNLGEYHDFYVQSDTLLLVDVFESLRNFCLKIYELIFRLFFYWTRITMAYSFKKDQSKIRSFN